jgi:Protein of unknown function (DUF4054)
MTPDSFKARFPEFTSETDVRIQANITDADPYFDRCKWGNLYESGVAYWVAHQIALANERAARFSADKGMANFVNSSDVGDVSYSKDGNLLNSSAKDPYLLTVYGQEYRRLSKLVGIGAVAV